jgi:hypothetical protein
MASFKTFLLSLTLLLLVSQTFTYDDHECDHDSIEQNPELLDIEEDTSIFGDEGRVLASVPNMRLYFHYDEVKKSAPASYAAYIQNELMPPIRDYYNAALKVKSPVVGNLKLGSSVSKICEISTPSVLKNGVAADFFIYLDTQAVSGTQIAATKYCYLASGTKRPLIARTMINRNMLPNANGNVLIHEKNMYVMMHETMHGLGFSGYQYPNFIDSAGKRLSGHIKSVKIAGSTRSVLDVKPLTDRLRKHYGCSSLAGAVLENEGGSGTASSHFERKIFLYEQMASGSIHGRRVTELSLALLEGSGWYLPDYSYAEPYFYGQGQGCGFITGTCSSTSSQFDEFCTGTARGCAPHGRGGGKCSSDSIMDGCKFIRPDEDYDCENDDGEDNARLPELQVFGRAAGSKCFTGDLNTRTSSNGRTSFCFKYTCSGTGSSTQVEVQVGKNKLVCTKEGKKTISGYVGSIDCPDPQTFCNGPGKKYCPRNCMGRGTCVNNVCKCNSGFKGVDCALKA